MISRWLVPWQSVECEDRRQALTAELRRELAIDHPRQGLTISSIALRQDTDDVLFSMADGRVEVVHLTWSRGRDGGSGPDPEVYSDSAAFVASRMLPDHRQWTDLR
jgi:hypothetical protein